MCRNFFIRCNCKQVFAGPGKCIEINKFSASLHICSTLSCYITYLGFIVQSRSGIFAPVLRIDHGFTAVIFDRATNTNFFMAAVENPTVSETISRSLVGAGSNVGPTSFLVFLIPAFVFSFIRF